MAFSITVRRGVEIPDGTPITLEILRLLALPVILIEGDVSSASIADGSVTASKLAATAVEEGKIATDAVTETKIKNSAVSNAKLGPGAVTYDKTTAGPYWYATGYHTAGVYAITLAPVLASYTAGTLVRFLPNTTNTGAVDLNVNSLGAKNLFKVGGQELAAGDLRQNTPAEAIYDGTQFILVSTPGNLDPTAYGTTAGTASAYTLSFASTTFPVLKALYAGARIRVKFHATNSASPTLAVDGLTAKQIRTSADLAIAAEALLINSWYELFYDPTANSSAGAWIITGGTFCSGNVTMPGAGATATFAHNLGRAPRMVRVVVVRTAISYDYAFNGGSAFPITQGDEIDITSFHMYGVGEWRTPAFQVKCDGTNIKIARLTTAANATLFAATQLGGGGFDPTFNSLAQGGHVLTDDYALKVYYE